MKKLLSFCLAGILICGATFAANDPDMQTVTSKRYVINELDKLQDKIPGTSGTKAVTLTGTRGGIEPTEVKESLGSSNSDPALPDVGAVNTGLSTKQNEIPAVNTNTVVTYTGTAGQIGQKGIYQDTGAYAAQSDNLIDAATFNEALRTGLNNEFVCAGGEDSYSPTGECWLWTIGNTYNANAQQYVSAVGTGYQDGTPTPTNPIEPVFYRQGDMILRKVGDYADSYDATTQKITRRVGVKVLDGTEIFGTSNTYGEALYIPSAANMWGAERNSTPICSHFLGKANTGLIQSEDTCFFNQTGHFYFRTTETVTDFNRWLAAQYAAGTPVTVWYPLATPTEETWTATTYNENVYIPQNQQ